MYCIKDLYVFLYVSKVDTLFSLRRFAWVLLKPFDVSCDLYKNRVELGYNDLG